MVSVNEFLKRQVAYSSSMTMKLNKINGMPYFTIYAWLDRKNEDTKFIALMGKYENQEPDELFKLALKELGVKKIKLGVVIQ